MAHRKSGTDAAHARTHRTHAQATNPNTMYYNHKKKQPNAFQFQALAGVA